MFYGLIFLFFNRLHSLRAPVGDRVHPNRASAASAYGRAGVEHHGDRFPVNGGGPHSRHRDARALEEKRLAYLAIPGPHDFRRP